MRRATTLLPMLLGLLSARGLAAKALDSWRTWVVFKHYVRLVDETPDPGVSIPPVPFGYEPIATYLLSGGRQDEVLGLEVSDVDLKRKCLTFRPNTFRRLKTKQAHRTVPLWPQLERILRAYLAGPHAPRGRLLFPSYRTGEERMLTDIRKLLDRVTARAGELYVMDHGHRRKVEPGEIRTKVFRHTYVTTRLQTTDHGQPVSVWTVAREVGHSATDMIERVYGHLGEVRHRAGVVEYRVQQHRRVLRGRLELVA